MTAEVTSRRSVLVGFAVTAVAGVAGYLVASNSDAAKAKSPTAAANGYGPGSSAGGAVLADVSAVPAGGGEILDSAGVVLTRDSQGTVHAFSSTCTHQGCTVNEVQDGIISCPCHGSRYDANTGAVVSGPATSPLPAIPVVVRDGQIYRS